MGSKSPLLKLVCFSLCLLFGNSRIHASEIADLLNAFTAQRNPAPVVSVVNPKKLHSLGDVGEYLVNSPEVFAEGLPEINDVRYPRELGPFFEALLPRRGNANEIEKRMSALDRLMDDSWLAAAKECGAYELYFRMMAHRGELQSLLLSYEKSGDEIAIIRLGEALANYTPSLSGIVPETLSSRTLALFLSGACGVSNRSGEDLNALAGVAMVWRESHPDLMAMLEGLRDPFSLRFVLIADEWQRRDFEAALERLAPIQRNEEWPMASFVNSLLLASELSDAEVVEIAKQIPTGILVSCIRQLLDDEIPGDAQAKIAILMMPEFHSRTDREKDHRISFSLRKARKVALRWWMSGREEDAYGLLEEAFFNLRPDENSDDLIRFAAIAKEFGKLQTAMDELDIRGSQPGYPELSLHKAALLTVYGNLREALNLARGYPDERMFQQLLIKCGEWDELREIAFGPSPPRKEKLQRICNAAFLNRDSDRARSYFASLSPDLKEKNALFLLLSGNHGMAREFGSAEAAKANSYSKLSIPLSMEPFEIWQNAVEDSLEASERPRSATLFQFIRHIKMSQNRAKTIAILTRLADALAPLESDESNRFGVAQALIALRAEEQGNRIIASIGSEEKKPGFVRRWAQPQLSEAEYFIKTDTSLDPGDQHDPKSTDFRTIDGMAEIRRLLEEGETRRAHSLFQKISKRILLDEFPDERVKVSTRTYRHFHSAKFSVEAELLPIFAAHHWDLDAPFLHEYALDTWRQGQTDSPDYLVFFLGSGGFFPEARIAALEHQHDGDVSHLDEILMLPTIDGMADATEGRVDAALGHLNVCMDLAPFDLRPGMMILSAFKKHGDEQDVQKAATGIRSFWKEQLAKYPESPQIFLASQFWLSEIEEQP